MSKYLVCASFAIIFTLIFLQGITIGQETGAVKGQLKDESGDAISSAMVTVRSKVISSKRSTVADKNGIFEIKSLSPGLYEITVEKIGLIATKEDVLIEVFETTVLNITLRGNCPSSPEGKVLEFNDGDKREVIFAILADVLKRRNLPDFDRLAKHKGRIILSSENIMENLVKEPTDSKILFLNKKRIKERANKHGDFLHLAFGEWKAGANCVKILISSSWALAGGSPYGYLGGGGLYYLFEKKNGKWAGQIIGGWVS